MRFSVLLVCGLCCTLPLFGQEEQIPHQPLNETDAPWRYPEYYPSPGVRAQRGGKWLGSDHLFNLAPNLGVVVEIIRPPKFTGQLTSEEQLRERIKTMLQKSQIKSEPERKTDKPALPFLHVLLLVYPVNEGHVAYCGLRLFEEVDVDRVQAAKGTVLQAITWEKQTLIFTPKDSLNAQVTRSVDELINAFTERYRFFETLKARQ